MTVHNDFFTWQSLATFAGTTTATTAVTNGICAVATGLKPVAALGLTLSILFCIMAAVIDPSTGDIGFAHPFGTYLIAVVNGFFVFASAAGLSAGATSLAQGTSSRRTRGAPATPRGDGMRVPEWEAKPADRVFWRRWF